MKKLLLTTSSACALMLFSSTAIADSDAHMSDSLTGPYIGIQGGYNWTSADVNGLADADLSGMEYGIFGGIQADWLFDNTINHFGTSVTGALQVDLNESSSDDTAGGISYDKTWDVGVSVRPGLGFLNNAMPFDWNPYGIMGYRMAEFEASAGGFAGDETFHGFELGIGTQLIAYENIGARLEYSHTWYGEEAGFDPSSNDIRVGLAYHF